MRGGPRVDPTASPTIAVCPCPAARPVPRNRRQLPAPLHLPLRGVAVGRKNHYGSRSERGTRVAALFYSLIESAKLCGVEPRAYLREATLRAVRNPGTATIARDLKSPESRGKISD
jgi:hypothetical protein